MRSHRRLPLTPMMLALAMPWAVTADLRAAENQPDPTTVPAPAATAPAAPAGQEQIAAQAAYAEALALYRKAYFAEARDKVDTAVRLDPGNADAQRLREDVLAILSQRDNRVQMAANWSRTLQDVSTQETAVRIGTLIANGDKKFASGDYDGAETDFDRAEVAIRSFPYSFPWGDLPAQVAGKRVEARAQARKQSADRIAKAREQAAESARAQTDLQQQALTAKVDELLARARESYSRKDYKRAEVDAWNAYELDRRREDARSLYLDARREGHALFDEKHEDERLERIARVSEEIHKSLIPQTELLVYPEDWKRRAQRKAPEIGISKDEPWRAAMNDRLEQRLTFDWQDYPFEDAIKFLREVTQANIIVAPSVTANNAGKNVTLKVKDMRFSDALRWMLELTGLKMALQDNAIFISNEALTGSVALRMYDVTDLIQQARDMPGRELSFAQAGGGGAGGGGGGLDLFKAADTTGTKPPDPQELVDFIKKNVAPDAWDEAKGTGIEQRAGSTLFISQTPEVHAQIELLLASLRNQQSLQVNMDIRLLNVRKNYFEEIGVDWSRGTMLDSSQAAGYTRQNNNSVFSGSIGTTNALPASQNADAWTQTTGGNSKGLVVDLAHSPFNFINTDQVNMIFSAAETESDVQIVEHPSLTCFNGQRANASFMTEYAYIGGYDIVARNMDPKIQILTFGNIIDIRPVVSSDRKYITMEVRPGSVALEGVYTELIDAPRIIDVGNNNGNNNGGIVTAVIAYPLEMPNVLIKSLRATVMIPDKANLLIGGFQNSLRQETQTGVPFLSHIPFLGRLFSRRGTYDDDRKLFYLLHAEILDLNEKEALQ
jgi:Bacterial type II and III secretion system protein